MKVSLDPPVVYVDFPFEEFPLSKRRLASDISGFEDHWIVGRNKETNEIILMPNGFHHCRILEKKKVSYKINDTERTKEIINEIIHG